MKMLDLLLYRSAASGAAAGTRTSLGAGGGGGMGRPIRVIELLQLIHGPLFRHLFGRPADALEKSTTKGNEYMIIENEPLVNTYISIPKEMSQLNCAAFVAGIVEGVCDAAGFEMEGVSAHWASPPEGAGDGAGNEVMWPGKTIYLLKFSEKVVEREEGLRGGGAGG
jgi:trafficking protein particle complex subunit 5